MVVAVQTDEAVSLDVLRALLPSATAATLGASADTSASADASYRWTQARDSAGRLLNVVHVRDANIPVATEIARTIDADEAASLLARDAEFRVALHARGHVFIHAAAVACDGRAILVPGRSFSGKSTLAAALVRAGAAYLSDEYAVLDEAGLVHAFPRRLRLRDTTGAPSGSHSAEELGGSTATAPLPIGLVVATGWRRGVHWDPRPLTAGETALALLDNTVVARLRPAYVLRVIARALHGASGLGGPRGEAAETARRILARAAAAPAV